MKYCCHCRAELVYAIPEGDDRRRHVCQACNTVHYQNPRIVAGCLPVWGEQILLCRRAIQPRLGCWTLPAGFMELGETTTQAGIRETWEEANARVEIEALYAVFNLPEVDQVYMMFRSRLLDLDFSPGRESLEVKLFTEDLIPWENIAFMTISETLRLYFSDRDNGGRFDLHSGDIVRRNGAMVVLRAGKGRASL